jgi:hypothetical protein
VRTGSSPTRHVSCKREQRLSPELPYRRTSREIYDRTTSCTSTSRTRLDRLAISCCFRAKAVRLRHHANVQGNAMSAQGAKARAINVLARRRAIRAQHGARHCIAHQGESMQGESCVRLRTRMGSNFRSPSSSNSVRNFFSLAAHSPQNHCAARPPRPSRPLRPEKSADGPVLRGSGAGAASTRGSADGRARARHV